MSPRENFQSLLSVRRNNETMKQAMECAGGSAKPSFCQAHRWPPCPGPMPWQLHAAPSRGPHEGHTDLTLSQGESPGLANLPPLAWRELLTFWTTWHSELRPWGWAGYKTALPAPFLSIHVTSLLQNAFETFFLIPRSDFGFFAPTPLAFSAQFCTAVGRARWGSVMGCSDGKSTWQGVQRLMGKSWLIPLFRGHLITKYVTFHKIS